MSENNNITMAESRNVTQCKSIVIMFISVLGDIMSENNDILFVCTVECSSTSQTGADHVTKIYY